jgi:hypothetical protein
MPGMVSTGSSSPQAHNKRVVAIRRIRVRMVPEVFKHSESRNVTSSICFAGMVMEASFP